MSEMRREIHWGIELLDVNWFSLSYNTYPKMHICEILQWNKLNFCQKKLEMSCESHLEYFRESFMGNEEWAVKCGWVFVNNLGIVHLWRPKFMIRGPKLCETLQACL